MMHVTYAGKSILTGDEVADLLVQYAAVLADSRSGDSVKVRGISGEGNEVVAHYLLDTGAPLMAETTHSTLPEPDNDEVVDYMRRKLREFSSPSPVASREDPIQHEYDEMTQG